MAEAAETAGAGPAGRFARLPLTGQFLLAGGVVMLAALVVTGYWVTRRIEAAVVTNTASATALYVDSFIAPLGVELASRQGLSDATRRALERAWAFWVGDGSRGDALSAEQVALIDELLAPSATLRRFLRRDVEDDRQRQAVLDRTARIERLDLGIEFDAGRGEPLQAHHRGAADGVEDAVVDGHGGLPGRGRAECTAGRVARWWA